MIDLNYKPPIAWRACAIPKKDGTSRYLLIPNDELKQAQRDVLDELYRNRDIKVHPAATGFIPFRSTFTGAGKHDRDTPLIIQLDVHNFFPSFPVSRVIDILKLTDMEIAKIDYIEKYCIFHGKKRDQFPQGSPTSPYLTNIGMYEVDEKLSGLAAAMGYRYTRYADDMAFSVKVPREAGPPEAKEHIMSEALEKKKALMAAAAKTLEDHLGLTISWKKTLCAYANSPRVPRRILGITIRKDNLGYNAPKFMRRNARALVHNLWKELKNGTPKEDLWPLYWKMVGLVGYSNNLRRKSDFIVSGFDPCIEKEKYDYIRKEFHYADRSF